MSDTRSSLGETAGHRASEGADRVDAALSEASDRVSQAAEGLKGARSGDDLGGSTISASPTLKDTAGQVAQQAKSTVAALADEARTRVSGMIDQQKAAGADQVAGVARAVQAAAGNLDQTSPQLARLVRSAADNVDHIADDIRSSNVADLLNGLAEFGRRQPIVFFGGAVLAGFALARFLKSDVPDASLRGSADDLRRF